MKDKKFGIIFLVSFLLVVYIPVMVHAQVCQKKAHHGQSLEKKILCKFRLVMANQDKLNLLDDQVTKIQNLKVATKKDLIKRNAEIDLISIDIKLKLWEDKPDKEILNKMLDQKFELKKEKAKALIDAYVELKDILSVGQRKKLKKITCISPKCYK